MDIPTTPQASYLYISRYIFAFIGDLMPWRRVKDAVLVLAIVLPSVASAAPTIQFPVNSQVPPVARASLPYTFTFAKSTFTSTAGPITYTLSDEPAWLRLDSGSHAFSGSPGSNDVGFVTFRLIATDANGPTPMSVTLVVIQNEGLGVGNPIFSQLAGFGVPSNPSSLFFYPRQSFAFHFSPDTFLRTSSSTIYYAISEDNSPLPSWLEFDASVLGFSGTTPPLVSPTTTPQTYGVKLVVSNFPGFLEASATFQIVIAYHILAFPVTIESINASSGTEVVSSPLRETLRLDGKPVRNTDLVSVTADAPSWLLLDHTDISLSGIPPTDATSLSVTISAVDLLGDIASATINFIFTSNSTRLFLDDVPVANATIGQNFSYSINRSSLARGNVTLTADLGSTSAWLAFDPDTLSFSGSVPQDVSPGHVEIALYATLEHEKDRKALWINIIRGSATASVSNTITMTASARLSSSSAIGSWTPSSTEKHSPLSRSTRLKIVLVAVLSTVFLVLLVTLIILCWRRKQKVLDESTADASNTISTPLDTEHGEPELSNTGVEGSAHGEEIERHLRPSEPPRLELSWTPDSLRKAKARLSQRPSARNNNVLNTSFISSLHKDLESLAHNSRSERDSSQQFNRKPEDLTPFVSTRTSNYSRTRTPLRPNQSKTEERVSPKRVSRALSAISTATLGLPSRLNGAGHGAGGAAPPGFNDIRSSWQDTESSLSSINSTAMAPNIVREFPESPVEGAGGRSIRSRQRNAPASVRLSGASSTQTDSPVDERQRWHTERACDVFGRGAPFPHAWSSRPYPGGRRLEADKSTPGHHDQSTPHNSLRRQWSDYAAPGPSIQPEITTPRRSAGKAFIVPLSKLIRNRSTASSGQFDSALSTSSSQWENDVLATEEDFQEVETQHPAQSARIGGQSISLHNSQSRRSTMTARRPSEISSSGEPDVSAAIRKLRLRDVPGQRPVSVGEGNLRKSQRSHQGSLAFI